jgi:hypothetical protein
MRAVLGSITGPHRVVHLGINDRERRLTKPIQVVRIVAVHHAKVGETLSSRRPDDAHHVFDIE